MVLVREVVIDSPVFIEGLIGHCIPLKMAVLVYDTINKLPIRLIRISVDGDCARRV